MRWLATLALVTSACSDEAPLPEPAHEVVYLSPTEHLARASMALRGTRPSVAELREVDRDPAQLPVIVDRYLGSPELGETIRELHAELLLVRFQSVDFTVPAVGDLANLSFNEINRSMFDEPLRLIEDVVVTDQPYTHIVTADYTMADRTVATIWGLPYNGSGEWERTHHPEPRNAGIFASPALFLRYRAVAYNFNRARANVVSRALLCHDFLEGDVKIDTSIDLSDPGVVSNAVQNNPACAACHHTLDPLASYFYGWPLGTLTGIRELTGYPFAFYNPGTVNDWFFTSRRPPGYFGRDDVVGLDGLGRAIAEDPRFARCAAINFAEYLTQQPRGELSPEWIAELQTDFTAHGHSAKQLLRSIILSDAFRISHATDTATAERVVGYQKVRPSQLARMLHDLTGFRWRSSSDAQVGVPPTSVWREGEIDYLDDDIHGYRVLEGGIDSFFVTKPVHTFNATSALVERAAAAKAAELVVARDAAAPVGQRALFALADVTTTDPVRVRAQLAYLHARIYSTLVGPDDPAVDETFELFEGALAASNGDARRAWVVTLTGMLSDIRAVVY